MSVVQRYVDKPKLVQLSHRDGRYLVVFRASVQFQIHISKSDAEDPPNPSVLKDFEGPWTEPQVLEMRLVHQVGGGLLDHWRREDGGFLGRFKTTFPEWDPQLLLEECLQRQGTTYDDYFKPIMASDLAAPPAPP